MKTFMLTLVFAISVLGLSGQILKPVSWEFEVSQNEDATYTFTAKAKMKGDWAIYSQHTAEGGPIPLSFSYDGGVKLIGETEEESEAIKKMSELFEIEVTKFKKEAVFTQKFTPHKGQTSIKGYLTFMCCDSKRCLPPTDIDFDVAL